MAFVIKNANTTAFRENVPILSQFIHVKKAAATLPATTTQNLFNVDNGSILVHRLVGRVTTAVQNQACNTKVTCVPDSGTAVDVAANVSIANLEVGAHYFVEGDGTAGVLSNAGAAYIGANSGSFIVGPGVIRYETAATNTGAMQWDIWYTPLDEGAIVTSA